MHQVANAGRARVERNRGKFRAVERHLQQYDAGIPCEQTRERNGCSRRTAAKLGAHDGDALSFIARLAQRLRHMDERKLVFTFRRRRGRLGRSGLFRHRRNRTGLHDGWLFVRDFVDRFVASSLCANKARRQPAPARRRLRNLDRNLDRLHRHDHALRHCRRAIRLW